MNAVAKLSHDQAYLAVNHNESIFTVIYQVLKSDIGISACQLTYKIYCSFDISPVKCDIFIFFSDSFR